MNTCMSNNEIQKVLIFGTHVCVRVCVPTYR